MRLPPDPRQRLQPPAGVKVAGSLQRQGHREALQAVGENAAGQARSGRPKGLARVACSPRPHVGSRQTLTETVNFASLAHGIRGLKITVSAVRFCRWWPPAKSGTYIERLVRKVTKVAALKFWDRTRWLIRNQQVVSSSLTAGSKISKESAPFFDPAAGRGHRWQRIGSRQTLETRSSIRDGFVVSCTGKASSSSGRIASRPKKTVRRSRTMARPSRYVASGMTRASGLIPGSFG